MADNLYISALLNFPSKQLIKVGAENGSGYFYCGPVDKFINNLDLYSRWLHDIAKRKLYMDTKFIPLRDRRVVDIFEVDMAADIEGALAVIIEGNELGNYYSIEEADGKLSFSAR